MTQYFSLFSIDAITQIILVFSVTFYLVECFFGYKCIKAFVLIIGFLTGFVAAFYVSSAFYNKDAYIPSVIGMAAGILLALIAFKLYLVGVFIFCGSVAAQAVLRLPLSQEGMQNILRIILCIIAFVVIGVLAVKFAKFCIICVTAIFGAINAINLLRTPVAVLNDNIMIRFAVIAVVAIAGIMIQRITTGRSR